MAGDTTGATIDGSSEVVVGKNNRQQIGGYGDQTVNVNTAGVNHNDDEHTATIRLVYELVSSLTVKIDSERIERNKSTADLRRDLDELRRIAHETQRQVEGLLHKAQAAVTIGPVHRTVFIIAFALLVVPIPLYYSDVRMHVGVSWQFALGLALLCYALSAIAWSYMWWGR